MLARRIEQRGEELRGAADLLLDLEPVEIEHHAGAVFADAAGKRLDLTRRIGRPVDHHMAELVRQRGEIAFRVDHHLLHHARALFEQAPQQVRLAAARIALDEQTGGEEFLDIEFGRLAGRIVSDGDLCCHCALVSGPNLERGTAAGRFCPIALRPPVLLANRVAREDAFL